MAAKPSIGDLIYEIRVPVLAAMAWAIVGIATLSAIPSSAFADAAWLSVRIAIAGTAGYMATRRGMFGLWGAAIAGAIVYFADHVIVKGVAFLVTDEPGAAVGVVISYVMFFWVAGLIGLFGGMLGKVRKDAAI